LSSSTRTVTADAAWAPTEPSKNGRDDQRAGGAEERNGDDTTASWLT